MENEDKKIRDLIFSDEFTNFISSANEKIKSKVDYVIRIIETQKVVSEKFVKKLENTDFL